jgi:flavin reductase (DIM6/NTAB) family NADH-FMN oxidoreductase RutF
MTANSFTSVCLEPPLVLISVAHDTNTCGFLEKAGCFGVNILSEEQENVGSYFARRPEDRRLDVKFSMIMAELGVPFLSDSLASLACQVINSHVYGDHTIYLGEVKEIAQKHAGAPLVFFRSRWYYPGHEVSASVQT